jgi:hypothetical protein
MDIENVKESDHRVTSPKLKRYLANRYRKPLMDVCPLRGGRDCLSENFLYPRDNDVIIYFNPPFSQLRRFAKKVFDLANAGVEVILVVPINQRTFLNRKYITLEVMNQASWCFLKNFRWGEDFRECYPAALMVFNLEKPHYCWAVDYDRLD